MTDRRDFLRCGAALAAGLASSRLVLANAPTEARLVMILLRGGLDGLHALAPYADGDYRRLRPTLALGPPGGENGVLDLNGYFGLHPALGPLHAMYLRRELLLIPAASTRYRNRSHFDGQNMLENGSGKPYGARDGWLNRALNGLYGGNARRGLALGPAIPLLLQGPAHVQTWSDSKLPELDEDFLQRMRRVYEGDPLFARALDDAIATAKPDLAMSGTGRQTPVAPAAARVAADLLARDDGPRVAVMEIQGWDTHFAQSGRLQRLFTQLADSVQMLKDGLGSSWSRSVIVVVSEFGRTAAENGSRGTDHGTGGLALVAGGAVAGGRIVGAWPGLGPGALLEGRDVAAANRYESLFKGILHDHLGVSGRELDTTVFPGSSQDLPMGGLIRAENAVCQRLWIEGRWPAA